MCENILRYKHKVKIILGVNTVVWDPGPPHIISHRGTHYRGTSAI